MQPCPHPEEHCEVVFPARDYISGECFRVVRCRRCGHLATTPVPKDPGRYYPAGYYGDAAGRRFPNIIEWLQRRLYARRAARVLGLLKGSDVRVLDVGCGRGHLLDAFRARGCTVVGTEFSEQAGRYARDVLKIPVRTGLLQEMAFEDASFDAVVLWHVLEHVSDPRPTLAEVSRILKPGGVLLVAVPDFGSPEARWSRAGWFHLDVPRHLSHHTRQSLVNLLATAGLRVAWTGHFALEYDCFSFVQSVLNRIGVRHNCLYNWLRGNKAKVAEHSASAPSLGVSLLLAPLLGLLSLPATFLLGLSGRGATVSICAVRIENMP